MANTSSNTTKAATRPALPLVWAGPILRRASAERLVLWLALSAPLTLRIRLQAADHYHHDVLLPAGSHQHHHSRAGEHLHYALVDLDLTEAPLPKDCWISYEISIRQEDGAWLTHSAWAPDCCYKGFPRNSLRRQARWMKLK